LNPKYKSKEKEEFDFGSACHALLLEGENRIAIIPFDDYRKDAAKQARDDARRQGKYPVLTAKVERVYKMREEALRALAACPHFKGLKLTDARTEQTLVWTEGTCDEEDGEAFCRARPDAYWSQINVALDYKSTTDASPGVVSRQIARMGFDFQDAFYRRGLRNVFGVEEPDFLFMFQENEEPFACSFHACAPSMREIAEAKVSRAIRLWRWMTEHDEGKPWPGYDPRVHFAEAPSWELSQHMDRMEEEQNGNPYDPGMLYGGIFERA